MGGSNTVRSKDIVKKGKIRLYLTVKGPLGPQRPTMGTSAVPHVAAGHSLWKKAAQDSVKGGRDILPASFQRACKCNK